MQEFPYFHAFPSIPVLTWVAQKYPSWLADVGLSCLPYTVTIWTAYCLSNAFTVCSKAERNNRGRYVHNLCPTKTVHLDFLLFRLRFFPVICILTASTLTLLMPGDAHSASSSSDRGGHVDTSVLRCFRLPKSERRSSRGSRRRGSRPAPPWRKQRRSRRPRPSKQALANTSTLPQCEDAQSHARAYWLAVYFTLYVTPTYSSLCHM